MIYTVSQCQYLGNRIISKWVKKNFTDLEKATKYYKAIIEVPDISFNYVQDSKILTILSSRDEDGIYQSLKTNISEQEIY